jgi:hypothetical protein
VRGLAQNLQYLTHVVNNAKETIQTQNGYGAVVRWDPISLREIVGDFHATLQECRDLLDSNNRYGLSTNALRNIEWNVLVQPTADRLRQRIMLHNSKILHFIKPFEIDLLTRVRQDIYRVHHDLAIRITAVHQDVQRIMGHLDPGYEQELNRRQQRQPILLEIPSDIADRFRFAALTERPEYESDSFFDITELSDAFVLNFDNSTRRFQGDVAVIQRMPPLEQYLNLLKCVWIYQRIQTIVPAEPAAAQASDSHWPSFVRQLEDELSTECNRFNGELVRPQITHPHLTGANLSIWPEKEPTPLVDVVTRDEIMEQVLKAPLQSSTPNAESSVRLLRRMGSDGRKYRILISGSERTPSGKMRGQNEVIDFDIASAIINPHYAMPSSRGRDREIILRRDERIARLSFVSHKDVLKFQQAVTGFKAWAWYCQYDVLVSFVVAGLKDPIVEKACVQLWIPKPVDGALVTNDDVAAESSTQSRAGSVGTLGSATPGIGPYGSSSDFQRRERDNSGTWSTRAPEPIPGLHQSPPMMSSPWARQDSTGGISISPPRNHMYAQPMPTPPSSHPRSIPRRPVPASSMSTMGQAPPSPRSSGPLSSSPPVLSSSPQRIGTTFGSNLNVPSNNRRTQSISSNMSNGGLTNSNSSGSDGHTLTISTGANTTGYLHQRPLKPRLVMFTQNPKDQQVSFVSIEIDDETSVNPERCNCRQSGKTGASCTITAIERRKGSANLEAKRYETSRTRGELDWNLARLASNTSFVSSASASLASPKAGGDETPVWANVKRVSLMFPNPEARHQFGGTPNRCRCIVRNEGQLKDCLREGHKGYLGEVQEFHRIQMNDYHRVRFESHQQVVNSPLMQG